MTRNTDSRSNRLDLSRITTPSLKQQRAEFGRKKAELPQKNLVTLKKVKKKKRRLSFSKFQTDHLSTLHILPLDGATIVGKGKKKLAKVAPHSTVAYQLILGLNDSCRNPGGRDVCSFALVVVGNVVHRRLCYVTGN